MALRSWETRRKRALDDAAAKEPEPLPDTADPYINARLSRVREQLDRIDVMMTKETDPQKLDRLASAQAKLAEQERQLAGRPLPGSLRPTGPAKRASIFDRAPAPAASSAPAKFEQE
jgi:hypothetical protein